VVVTVDFLEGLYRSWKLEKGNFVGRGKLEKNKNLIESQGT